jgi:hypothetical protein
MDEQDPKQKSKKQKVSLYKKQQDYDPLLLIQSIPEIRLHAKRTYQDGLQKFLRKVKGRCKSSVIEQYKRTCVCQAQKYVKDLLRANYSIQKKARAGQVVQDEETLEPQSVPHRWDKEAKWRPVWTQMKAKRKQIVSELGSSPQVEQVYLCQDLIR